MDKTFEFGLVSYVTLDRVIDSPVPEHLQGHNAYHEFLSFLGLAQHLGIDFIPITWHSALEGARRGRTARIQQMAIDLQKTLAFKRLSSQRPEQRARDMSALTTELAVLGHPAVRDHSHLSRLEGVCWDITPGTGEVWPVLVLEKAPHGDLMSFMEQGPGSALSFSDRLGLCGDIAGAIRDMHRNSIIHGDIKPQNVLIFNNASQTYTARVSDFGYSTIFAHSDARIKMPATEHWVAPEWNHRNVTTNSEGAQKMDVYSLGVLCLWLLFYNKNDTIGGSTSDYFAQRRSGMSLITLVGQHMKGVKELCEEKRRNLQLFFDDSLQHDPALRCLTVEAIVNLIAPERAQDHRMPATLVAEIESLRMPHFQVASSIAQLYLADYRVRKFVAKCLKESMHLELKDENLALELALCYEIGFGTDRDKGVLTALLQQTGIRTEDLEKKLFVLKQTSDPQPVFRNSMYSDLVENGQDFRVDFPENYCAEHQLEVAILWYRREAADLEDIFGSANPLTLIVKTELCHALRKADLLDEAITLRGQITELMTTTKGERDPDTLASMSQLAAMHIDNGNLDEAERLLLGVRSIQASTLEAENVQVLETTNALAGIYRARGRFQNAEDMLLPAVGIRERLLGPEHPDTLRLISSLAATYLGQQRLEEAQKLLEKLVKIRKAQPGVKNTATLSNMSNLATVYYHQEKFDDAKELYSQVIDVRMDLFGEEHRETLLVASNLASLYKKLGKLEDAERMEQRLLQTKTRLFGEDSKSTLTTQGNLALTYAYQERWQEAKNLGRKVVDMKRKVVGRDHPSTLSSILNLAEVYVSLEQMEEAKTALTQGMHDAVAAGRVEQFETKAIMSMLLSMT